MEQLKRLRTEKGLSQARLAARAEVDPSTVNQIERGAREASPATLRKIAHALDVSLFELLEDDSPKAEPSLPFSPEPSEAERRLTQVPEVLGRYIFGRTERHEAELDAVDSPHFRTATSATLWLAGIEEEAAAWTDWALAEAIKIMPVPRTGSKFLDSIGAFVDGVEVMGFMLSFVGLQNRAEARIKAMSDVPDEIALKRLAKATTAVDEARERFEGLRANG